MRTGVASTLLVSIVLGLLLTPTSGGLGPAASAAARPEVDLLRAPAAVSPLEPPRAAAGAPSVLPAWGNLTASLSVSPPGNEWGRSVAYDPVDRYVVLFGGYLNHTYLNATWTYRAGHWKELFPPTSPPARDHSNLVYDAQDGYLLLFGGANTAGSLNDTWSFRGGLWTQLHPSNAPSPRWAAQMAYLPSANVVILFGGCSANVERNDTWEYAGGTWTNLSLSHSPSPRGDAAFAAPGDNSSFGSELILFGGTGNGAGGAWSSILDDTWRFENGVWQNLTSFAGPAPPARREAAFAWDAASGSFVLFGGSGPSELLNDTWQFSGPVGAWSALNLSRSPSPRAFPMFANDSADGYLLLFGGVGAEPTPFNDTWILEDLRLSSSAQPPVGPPPSQVLFPVALSGGFGAGWINLTYGDGSNSSNHVASLATSFEGSNMSSFSHLYRTPGSYSCRIVATDELGAFSTANVPVFVSPPPDGPLELAFSASPARGVAPLNVSFSARPSHGQLPYDVAYSFGDGQAGAGANLSHVYAIPGNYTVNVTASDALGEVATASESVVVVAPLIASASVSPVAGNAPFSVTFRATATQGLAPYYVVWNFGDGTNSSSWNGTHLYADPLDYELVLTIVDAAGEHFSYEQRISVNGPAPSAGGGGPLGGASGELLAFLLGALVAGTIVAVLTVAMRERADHR